MSRAMHERVQLCQDPQTEFALRESLGASRINHILRVHGHTILEEQRSAAIYDEIGQQSLRTALPGPHRGQHDASDPQHRPLRNWVQKSVRHRSSCTPGSTHRSQTAHPGYDPRRSLGKPSPRSRSWRRVSLRSSRQPPPPISAHSTVMSKQRRSCMFRRQPDEAW